MKERSVQCQHAIHCFNLYYYQCFVSLGRCEPDVRGMWFSHCHHFYMLMSLRRLSPTWWPWSNSRTGSITPTQKSLTSVNPSATSPTFPSAIRWTPVLHTVADESTTYVAGPVPYTMEEQLALTHLALTACLLLTTSASAIVADAAEVAISSLPVERALIMVSVPLLVQHPFLSVLPSHVN